MPPIDFTLPKIARISYSYENFSKAKMFFFGKWCQVASSRKLIKPTDLSSACKYGSLFTQSIFGGAVRGNYEHQFNIVDGRRVDLSHDSLDVGRMSNPYLHEQSYFDIPETRASLTGCSSRAEEWATEFMGTMGDKT